MSSDQYRKSHCGDKTILRPSYLHNGISYTGKMSSLYWIRALVTYVSIVRISTPKRRCLRCKYSPWCCNSMINKIQHWKQALQWQWRTKHTFIPWMLKRYTVTQGRRIGFLLRILEKIYCRQSSNIMRAKSHNLNVSRIVLRLSLPNPLETAVKSRMKM